LETLNGEKGHVDQKDKKIHKSNNRIHREPRSILNECANQKIKQAQPRSISKKSGISIVSFFLEGSGSGSGSPLLELCKEDRIETLVTGNRS
jgi:hypothetical protein